MTSSDGLAGGLKRRPAKCPECGHIFTITYRAGVRYFRAPRQRCPECDHITRRAAFGHPEPEDYA